MLTSPITNDHFRSKIFEVVERSRGKQSLASMTGIEMRQVPIPSLGSLTAADSPLTPEGITPQLIGVASNWIDLCSPDPLVSDISRQVLHMEVAYAAFCGIDHIIVPGPVLYYGDAVGHGEACYGRALHECFSIAAHSSFYIKTPMFEHPDLSDDTSKILATRDEYLDDAEDTRSAELNVFSCWDAWNVIRTVCKYNSRLFVGKNKALPPAICSQLVLDVIAILWKSSWSKTDFVRYCPLIALRQYTTRFFGRVLMGGHSINRAQTPSRHVPPDTLVL